MNHDRHLVETIKQHFAGKSSAQLRAIARANDEQRWSAEAVAAAHDVLIDRAAGQAQEPLIVEEEPRSPSPLDPYKDPYDLAFVSGLIALRIVAGVDLFPRFTGGEEGSSNADQPVPFGSAIAWLALDTRDAEGVATALGLRALRPATWAKGIAAAHRSSVYITPPLADWTLAVGTALFPPDKADAFVKPLLERLSRQFGEAQYFCTHREVELYVWARARKGRLVRGFGWLGKESLTLWDEGAPTKEERDLGFRFCDGLSTPDEQCVTELAYLWSIDPTTLDEQFKEPVMGLLGSIARTQSQTAITELHE